VNHQIRRISGLMAFGLLALLINVGYTQIFNSDSLRQRQDNTRLLLEEYGRQRGTILAGNLVIAQSLKTDGTLAYERDYPLGAAFAPATGFYSLVYGATGIERLFSEILSGNDDRLAVDRLQQLLAGKEQRGGVVQLTIDPDLQKAAYSALNGRTGAAVVIDSQTGEILALVSSPSFNPNELSNNSPDKIRKAYEALLADANKPMDNRPLTTSLPPGSTFKLVVAAAALESGKFDENSLLPAPASLKLPLSNSRMHNWQNGPCTSSGKITLRQALAVSCNTTFAWLGMKLGADAIREQAEKFGFNTSISIPMNSSTSVFPTELDGAQTALSSIGQFEVRATALQMAMVVSAIANGGQLMQPHLVDKVLTSDLAVLDQTPKSVRNQALSPAVAKLLNSMMKSVVNAGTAYTVKIPGIEVGAKTGTADSGTDKSAHAWMVANATKGGRTISLAVVVENGGGAAEVSGNRIAGPIVAKLIRQAFL
jgi:peptidoglycan glycosyltransferase